MPEAEWDNKTERLSKDEWKKLKGIIGKHKQTLSDVERRQEAYDGEYKILKREKKRPDDPNHRIAANYAKIIVGMPINYMLGKPVSYDVPKEQLINKKNEKGLNIKVFEQLLTEYDEAFTNVMEENDDHAVTMEIVRDGHIAGVSVVLFYFDSIGDIRYKAYTVNECIPIIDSHGELTSVIHVYKDEEDKNCVDIYDSQSVTYLVKDGENYILDNRRDVNPAAHYLPVVPAAIYVNGKKAKPTFTGFAQGVSDLSEDVLSIIDEYHRLISDNQNRLDVFCDPFLKFIGAHPSEEAVLNMRKARAISVKGKSSPGGQSPNVDVGYLEWSQEYKGVEAQADRLINDLFDVSQTPKIFKQEANGATSGVAIRQMYTPLDNKVNEKEPYLNKFIRRKIMIITFMMNAKRMLEVGQDPISVYEGTEEPKIELYDWRWMYWEVHRNLPQNTAELVDMLVKLSDVLSEWTILKNAPFVENVQEEIERKRQEATDAPKANIKDVDSYLSNLDEKIKNRSFDDDEL